MPSTSWRGWTAVGSPFDCSASGRGEQLAPAALRRAGLLTRLGIPDAGDAHEPLPAAGRDERTGVLALAPVVAANAALRDAVAAVYAQDRRPLVLGGDCGCLLGAIAAAADRYGPIGLVLADGHADYWDGATSGTGELADMSTAVINGHGPAELTGLAATTPMVPAADTVLLGYRDDPDIRPGEQQERERVPAGTALLPGPELRRPDAAPRAAQVTRRVAGRVTGLWLHVDVDVLDEGVLAAVTYPKPDGPDVAALSTVLQAVLDSGPILGLSVADLRPDLDATAADLVAGLVAELVPAANPLMP